MELEDRERCLDLFGDANAIWCSGGTASSCWLLFVNTVGKVSAEFSRLPPDD
jgi:hypothetical protein